MTDGYDGADVIDASGDHVGKVGQTYVDDAGRPRYVSVKMDGLLPSHRLVPVDDAQLEDDGLHVSYVKDMIKESPSIHAGESLEGDALGKVRDYYANDEVVSQEAD